MNISLSKENWNILYNGFGNVIIDNDEIILHPKSADSKDKTHAALVLSNLSVRDFTLQVKANTVEQLRINDVPNAWEVFWLFFNYNPTNDGKKKTNYFIFKPNGCELGSAWSESEQKIIVTPDSPTLLFDNEYIYEIKKDGLNIQISIDGSEIINYKDENNYLFENSGYIGLYSEDALVRISEVNIDV